MSARISLLLLAGILLCLGAGHAQAQARNAAFVDPASAQTASSTGGKGGASTVVADPAQTDAGETLVNVARRVTVFFYNGFRTQVTLNQLTMNADGNVRSKVLSDDCKALKNLPPQARCSVVLEVVPSSPGPWSVELLMNHSGQGRIARAEVVGSTLGKTDEKSEGLAVSKKISAPIDFGNVHAQEETASRTMLIENDSTEPLKIASVDLIAADKSDLQLRDGGCAKDDDLKPGESCPITLLWSPQTRGNIATDLIVHHSGNLGFVVVPIRGSSDGDKDDDGKTAEGGSKSSGGPKQKEAGASKHGPPATFVPGPPSMDQIAKAMPPMDGAALQQSAAPSLGPVDAPKSAKPAKGGKSKETSKDAKLDKKEDAPADAASLKLIGSVNGRAILGDENDQSFMVGLGETVSMGDTPVSLLQLDANRAVVSVAGARKELRLRQGPVFIKSDTKSAVDLGGSGGGGAGGGSPPLRAGSSTGDAGPGGIPPAATGGVQPPPSGTSAATSGNTGNSNVGSSFLGSMGLDAPSGGTGSTSAPAPTGLPKT